MKVITLRVVDGEEGFMATYSPQVATVQDVKSLEDAAKFNVGSHPDYDQRGRPYRVIVVPQEHWHEFEVFSDAQKGRREFVAYPSTNPTFG